MSRRVMKYAALVVSGGMVLQLAGCGALVADLAIQTLGSVVLNAIMTALLGSTTTALSLPF